MLGIIGCMDTSRGVHPKCQGLGTKGGRMGASGFFFKGRAGESGRGGAGWQRAGKKGGVAVPAGRGGVIFGALFFSVFFATSFSASEFGTELSQHNTPHSHDERRALRRTDCYEQAHDREDDGVQGHW